MASSENKKLQVNEKSSFESTEEEEDTKGKPFSSISIRQSSELDRTKEEDYSQKDEDVDSSRLSTITDAIVSAFSKEEEENDSQKEDSNGREFGGGGKSSISNYSSRLTKTVTNDGKTTVYKSEDKNREEVTPGGGGTTTNIINKKKKSNDNHDDVKEEKMSSERAKILEEEKKMFSKVQQPTRSKFIEAPRKSEVVVTNETVRECLNPLGQEVTEEICVPSSSYKTFTTLNQEVEDEIIVPKSTCVLNTKPTLTSSAQMIGGSAKSYGAEMQTRVLTMKISGNTDINMEDFKNKMETCVEEMQPGCSKDMSIDSKTRESNEGNLEREITLTLKSGSQSIDSQKLQQEMYNALTRRSKKFEHGKKSSLDTTTTTTESRERSQSFNIENKHQTESASIKIREFKLSMSDQVDFDITDFSQKMNQALEELYPGSSKELSITSNVKKTTREIIMVISGEYPLDLPTIQKKMDEALRLGQRRVNTHVTTLSKDNRQTNRDHFKGNKQLLSNSSATSRDLTLRVDESKEFVLKDFRKKMNDSLERIQPGSSKLAEIETFLSKSDDGRKMRNIILKISGYLPIDTSILREEMINAAGLEKPTIQSSNVESHVVKEINLHVYTSDDFDSKKFTQQFKETLNSLQKGSGESLTISKEDNNVDADRKDVERIISMKFNGDCPIDKMNLISTVKSMISDAEPSGYKPHVVKVASKNFTETSSRLPTSEAIKSSIHQIPFVDSKIDTPAQPKGGDTTSTSYERSMVMEPSKFKKISKFTLKEGSSSPIKIHSEFKSISTSNKFTTIDSQEDLPDVDPKIDTPAKPKSPDLHKLEYQKSSEMTKQEFQREMKKKSYSETSPNIKLKKVTEKDNLNMEKDDPMNYGASKEQEKSDDELHEIRHRDIYYPGNHNYSVVPGVDPKVDTPAKPQKKELSSDETLIKAPMSRNENYVKLSKPDSINISEDSKNARVNTSKIIEVSDLKQSHTKYSCNPEKRDLQHENDNETTNLISSVDKSIRAEDAKTPNVSYEIDTPIKKREINDQSKKYEELTVSEKQKFRKIMPMDKDQKEDASILHYDIDTKRDDLDLEKRLQEMSFIFSLPIPDLEEKIRAGNLNINKLDVDIDADSDIKINKQPGNLIKSDVDMSTADFGKKLSMSQFVYGREERRN
nr:uncharacterized protein LOC121124037 [Lepeophtheirus salmonis]XP_040575070.1 uncharacterized protein LOC121124037 [Lepeophtheirus salmonis]XP_040575071.1 uncharacterized protein LOC121124037 [Lepeophtheirus salmonis]XP_040575072.1 uncharacterized protein LOC121124037 [Lepeophtheirus salmonis]